MTKILFLLTSVLLLSSACDKKLPLKNGDLTGYCGYEIIKSDKGLLSFVSDSTYKREGDMYIETSGSYFIKADTLYINYSCENYVGVNNISKTRCAQQAYIMTSTKTLKIVGWRNKSGEIQPIPKQYQDIELFKK